MRWSGAALKSEESDMAKKNGARREWCITREAKKDEAAATTTVGGIRK